MNQLQIKGRAKFNLLHFATVRSADTDKAACAAVQNLIDDKEKVKSLTGFRWVLDAISDIMIAV